MMRWGVLVLLGIGLISFMFVPGDGLFYRPEKWPKPLYNFDNNPVTHDGFILGRTLFYDPILSQDSTVSCASCHFQYTAFAHVDHSTSHGINSRVGKRNAPGLMNLAWYPTFHWDGGVLNLNGQAINPLTHPDELGETLEGVLKKLNRNTFYKKEFKKVFGAEQIKTTHLLKALGQFTVSLVSANSKYDSVMRKESTFTEQEQRGYSLFLKYCNQCHTAPLFTNFEFKANGIGPLAAYIDSGRAVITGRPSDVFLFRVPTLRNIDHSFPYMHDGRISKLKDVIHHYANSSNWVKPISKELKTKNNLLSPTEEKDLLKFLKTLTDRTFLLNTNFQYHSPN
jgi:cytochrome c peroxidase